MRARSMTIVSRRLQQRLMDGFFRDLCQIGARNLIWNPGCNDGGCLIIASGFAGTVLAMDRSQESSPSGERTLFHAVPKTNYDGAP